MLRVYMYVHKSPSNAEIRMRTNVRNIEEEKEKKRTKEMDRFFFFSTSAKSVLNVYLNG